MGGISLQQHDHIPDYKTPIEARLAKYLKIWRDDRAALSAFGLPVEQEIAKLLEWYICECLAYGPKEVADWWSDGVVQLKIEQTNTDSFKLLGVTWIDSQGLAPFEIDVELNPADDHLFARTRFRIGSLDGCGRAEVRRPRIATECVLEKRPKRDRDWAMAVELAPPEQDRS